MTDDNSKKVTKKQPTIPQNTVISMVIMTALLGWALGYGIGASTGNDTSVNKAENSDHHHSNEDMPHSHDVFEVDAENAPSVKLLVEKDKKTGWNLTLVTQNFTFTPIDVNDADEENTGHAHVYVDGEKVDRIYGNYHYLNPLGEGEHQIKVTLNTNSHMDYAIDGEVIGDTIEITELVEDAETTSSGHHGGY